jgi:hypothetical protein
MLPSPLSAGLECSPTCEGMILTQVTQHFDVEIACATWRSGVSGYAVVPQWGRLASRTR